jgi:CO/xanthine dehydrogenase Mo-binding subunit
MIQDEKSVTVENGLNRRDFLKFAGTGLVMFFWTGPALALQQQAAPAGPPSPSTDPNAYIRIGADGRVTCFVGKIEMGQGLQTALAQNLAEELEVSFDSIDMVMGDTDLCPWDIGTFGSMGNRILGPIVRSAAAETKAVLLQMAADRFGAPLERLQVKDGVITDSAQGKRVTYAELVQGKRIERRLGQVAYSFKPNAPTPLPAIQLLAPVRPPSSFKTIGQSLPRKDAIAKVTGQAKYTADMVVPGTVFARILRPPAHGAKLKSVDSSAAEKVAGVQVVRDDDLIAVVADKPDVADKALSLVKAQFDPSPSVLDEQSIFDHLVKAPVKHQVIAEKGNLAEGEKLGAIFEQTYLHSYGAHAHMETHSTLAKIENGKATLWASTQQPFSVRAQVAQALGLTPQNVRVITPYVGGGFGGKNYVQNGIEAARLARKVGKPVLLVWDRAEDFFYDRFRPAGVVKIRSAMNSAGQIVLWDYTVYAAGDWGAVSFYDVPHTRTVAAPETQIAWRRGTNADGVHPFNVGAWRMPGTNTCTFARESHIDILANKAGVDPLEFRMKHLSDPRMRGVLDAVAKQFGWKPGRTPSGRGVGVACGVIYGTYVATMAEVGVNKSTGEVAVKRVVTAVDPGTVVNPEGARQQVEGCIVMGLGYALTEEVRFKNGEVLDRNFDTYQLPRFSAMPKMEVVLVDNRQFPPDGIGEPPIITMGAVIANAVYDAVGVRLLQLPMTPVRVKEALSRV